MPIPGPLATAVATVGANDVGYDDNTVAAESTYRYRVAAYNGAGESDWVESNSVVTPAAPPGPSLTATGYKVKGRQAVDLAWTGAAGDVDIRRDDSVISTQSSSAEGSGTWTDNIGAKGGGSYSYQVCDAGTTACSAVEVVVF